MIYGKTKQNEKNLNTIEYKQSRKHSRKQQSKDQDHSKKDKHMCTKKRISLDDKNSY